MGKGHWIVLAVTLSGMIAIALPPSVSHSADSGERKVPYTGPKISSWTLMCKATHMAAGGFWRDLSDTIVSEGARFEKEPRPTHWSISISKDKVILIGQTSLGNVFEVDVPADPPPPVELIFWRQRY